MGEEGVAVYILVIFLHSFFLPPFDVFFGGGLKGEREKAEYFLYSKRACTKPVHQLKLTGRLTAFLLDNLR